ncbi:peptidase S10, serine carboxypeptidase [Cladochytrium replicatum]|nr:peptidase S10, serine carboxypeptidase [Cladochytrium replicatum]
MPKDTVLISTSSCCSSLLGLFLENGPVRIQPDGSFKPNRYSWHTVTNSLFIEQPVGVGFSFHTSESSAVYNTTGVGIDLHSFLGKFYEVFQETASMNLYVTRESYAGRYIPGIADNLVFKNKLTLPNG